GARGEHRRQRAAYPAAERLHHRAAQRQLQTDRLQRASTSTTRPTRRSRGTEAPVPPDPLPAAPVTAPASAAAATTTAPTATAQGPSDLSSGRRRRAATDQAVPSGRQPPKRTPMIPAGSHIVPIARASVTSSALAGSPLVTPMATFTP